MRTTDASEILMKDLDEQRNSLITSITSGRLSYEEYMRLCGSLQGINFAKSIIADLAKTVNEEGDEDYE